jgi:transcriptional regulator with XRE-family HTH domain
MKPVEWGTLLAARRREAGLTQAGLARRMGTAQSAISRIEAGRALPSIGFLERFAGATGQPLTVVFGTERTRDSRRARRERVRRVLGSYRFNPWERGPTVAEARTLIADGLTRERFEGSRAARSGSPRA